VREGIKKDIKLRLTQAPSQDRRDEEKKRGNIRLKALSQWLKSDRPLSYGDNGDHKTYDSLVRAVAPTETAAYHGLPNWHDNSFTHESFVASLINSTDPESLRSSRAPLLKDGSFLPVLLVACNSILKVVHMQGVVSQKNFLHDALTTALTTFGINFFPYHRQNSRSRGAPHSVPVFDAWANLGARRSLTNQNPISDPSLSIQPTIEPETVAYNNALASDSNAPWQANSLHIRSLRKFLNMSTLPTDFTPPSLSPKDPYVNQTGGFTSLRCRSMSPVFCASRSTFQGSTWLL
jgi:hypothetical protein